MALQASGAISFNDVNVELGRSGTTTISLNEASVRTLFGVASGAISMSNGYGKSNDVYFISILSVTGSRNHGMYVDTSGNLYICPSGGSASRVMKLPNTGASITWQKTAAGGSTDPKSGVMFTTSAGNTYLASAIESQTPAGQLITSFNSSGATQWQTLFETGTSTSGTGINDITVDSSGNIITTNNSYRQGPFAYFPTVAKYNSSGVNQWYFILSNQTVFNSGVAADSSGNIYYGTFATSSSSSATRWQKVNASGTAVATATSSVNSYDYNNQASFSCIISPAGSFVAVQTRLVSSSYSAHLVKMSASDFSVTWSRLVTLSSGSSGPRFHCVVSDASDNYYVTGDNVNTNTRSFRFGIILKYNSSGVLQWQREILNGPDSYGVSMGNITLNSSGTIMYISASAGSSASGVVFALPTDGSKTGTYTVGGITVTYQAGSLADNLETYTTSSASAPSRTGDSRTISSLTRTFSDSAFTISNSAI